MRYIQQNIYRKNIEYLILNFYTLSKVTDIMKKVLSYFVYLFLVIGFVGGSLALYYDFVADIVAVLLLIWMGIFGFLAISCACIQGLTRKDFVFKYDYPYLLICLLIVIIDVSPYAVMTLQIYDVIHMSKEYLIFFVIAYTLLLNLIIILIFLISCHKDENYLKKLPCIRNEAMFITAFENPMRRTYLAYNIPFTYKEFKDPNQYLRGDYAFINYTAQIYEKYRSDKHTHYHWSITDVDPKHVIVPYAATDITIAGKCTQKLNPEIFANLLLTPLSKGNFNYRSSIDYCDGRFYYPNGEKSKVGDMRYEIKSVTTKQKLAFVAEIGNGIFKLLPILPKSRIFFDPEFYLDVDENYMRYGLLKNHKMNVCMSMLFILAFILIILIWGGYDELK